MRIVNMKIRPDKCLTWSGPKLSDTWMVFPKILFENVYQKNIIKKNSVDD